MSNFPDKSLIQKVIPWLFDQRKNRLPPFVSVEETRSIFNLNENEYRDLFHWFFGMKIWKPIGQEQLEITEFVEEFESRFGLHTKHLDFHLLHRFSNEREVMGLIQIIALASARKQTENPSITLKALLSFGEKTSEGRLVEAAGVPWFKIIEMINKDPESIYQIDPFTWEEIIAGAYDTAGFDEVILTPRSGDKGRDVIAVINGVGSIKIVDQVKAYSPGHLVTANDVRALAGVISMEQDVSKGVITTTSDFAPKVRDDALIKKFMPYRLELRPRQELLPWLQDIVKNVKIPGDKKANKRGQADSPPR